MRQHAASLAATLRKEAGAEVELIDGSKGELTVTVDGHQVASKGDSLPSVDEVLAAVRRESAATAAGG